MKLLSFFLLLIPFLLLAETIRIDGVDFYCRIPRQYNGKSKIMVLFGGRNWRGDRTLKAYNFNALADKHNLFLLSPSFKDRDYWEPEAWSGNLLNKAISQLEKRYHLQPQKVYLYGYSAGGQCTTLFSQWMPERIAAWGIHACGVYPERIHDRRAPALITCGVDDKERFQISRNFIYRYREAGGNLLWKPFPQKGHELNKEALEMAKAWFDALLSGEKNPTFGEDETGQIGGDIDVEFRNPLYNKKIMELWKR